MTISFMSSLLLVCFITQIVCRKIGINNLTFTKERDVKTFRYYKYEVSNDRISKSSIRWTSYSNYGSNCLAPGEVFGLGVVTPKEKSLKEDFNLSFNSGAYTQQDFYDGDAKGSDGDNFCVLWGTWHPSADNEDSDVELYINVFTKKAELLNRFLFNFDLKSTEGALTVKIELSWMLGGEYSISKSFTDVLPLIDTKCKETDIYRDQFVLKELKTSHQGDGNFLIALLVDRADEDEIKSFIQNTNTDKKLIQGSSSIWGRLICNGEKFEFSTKSSGTSGTGFQLLI